MQNQHIKNDSALITSIFHLIGNLLVNYKYSNTFKNHATHVLKNKENVHLTVILAQGIKFLAEKYECKQLIPAFIQALTEWQTEDYLHNTTASKHCSQVLVNMTSLMPDIMTVEIISLIRFLNHESYTLRMCVLNIIVEVTINALSHEDLSDEQKDNRDLFLQQLEMHILDSSANVRSKVLNLWCKMQIENAIPIEKLSHILHIACGRLKDKVATVRRNVLILITRFIQTNQFSSMVCYF